MADCHVLNYLKSHRQSCEYSSVTVLGSLGWQRRPNRGTFPQPFALACMARTCANRSQNSIGDERMTAARDGTEIDELLRQTTVTY